ncbi:hypothetical protein JTB14_019181 [Gonioctena quinquepunctata]|nr:hypothetical protein JTB14_019181 [Gonioctena quinquepunctata]
MKSETIIDIMRDEDHRKRIVNPSNCSIECRRKDTSQVTTNKQVIRSEMVSIAEIVEDFISRDLVLLTEEHVGGASYLIILRDENVLITSIEINEVQMKNELKELVRVEGSYLYFKIDTGSQVNVLSYINFPKMNGKVDGKLNMKQSNIILESFGGFKVKTIGSSEHKLGIQQ